MELSEQYKRARKDSALRYPRFWPAVADCRPAPQCTQIVAGLRKIGVPSEWLEWHGHNDFHKVLVNATTAWLYGCCAANSSIFGVGERTGNSPLEALVIEHAQLKGQTQGVNYAAITELADYASKELGFKIPDNFPLVGRDFNVTRAGIHADGLLKDEEIYNCFDTQKLLGRPVTVAITDKTGAAGIKHWIESHFQIEIPKHNPRVTRIKNRIDQEYANERLSVISDEEMLEWMKEAFGDELPPPR